MTYCPADAFEDECQNPDNPYGGSAEELFGMDNVLFPGISRPDYAVNPLSGFGTVRIPDNESMGTVRIPDNESMGWFGQDAAASAPTTSAATPSHGMNGGVAGWVAAALLLGGAYFAKGGLKNLLNGAGIVAAGVSSVGLVSRFLK
jgi:hypothetical protein